MSSLVIFSPLNPATHFWFQHAFNRPLYSTFIFSSVCGGCLVARYHGCCIKVECIVICFSVFSQLNFSSVFIYVTLALPAAAGCCMELAYDGRRFAHQCCKLWQKCCDGDFTKIQCLMSMSTSFTVFFRLQKTCLREQMQLLTAASFCLITLISWSKGKNI